MKVLFKDEKYKDETLDILAQLMKDAKLTGDLQVIDDSVHSYTFNVWQVVISDQLTCKIMPWCK